MARLEPCPTPIMAITQATPMMMPRAVNADRILLRAIAFMPTFRIVRTSACRYPFHSARRRSMTGRSSTSLPSRKPTMRLAWAAMSASCVMRTIVLPSSFSF